MLYQRMLTTITTSVIARLHLDVRSVAGFSPVHCSLNNNSGSNLLATATRCRAGEPYPSAPLAVYWFGWATACRRQVAPLKRRMRHYALVLRSIADILPKCENCLQKISMSTSPSTGGEYFCILNASTKSLDTQKQ